MPANSRWDLIRRLRVNYQVRAEVEETFEHRAYNRIVCFL